MQQALTLLPLADWLAIVWFFGVWVTYSLLTRNEASQRQSLMAITNRYRIYWMRQATGRSERVLDAIIMQNLSTTPSLFSSTTIIVIGGLFALLGSTDKAADLVKDIPFTARTTAAIFDIKVTLLIAIFIYAFFRFSWCLRQYTFVTMLIGSMPEQKDFENAKFDKNEFAERAGRMLGSAAETFNGGLRAYYFAFSVIAWFFSPLAFAFATAFVVLILYSREYRSDVLKILR